MLASAPLGLDLAAALDPALFAADALGFALDPWQRDVLRSVAPRLLLNCCRQSGKSTITAALACHMAVYRPGALVLLLSPSERQSKELHRKVLEVYRATGRSVPADAENVLSLMLENGSRVIALPGREATVRGFSGVDLLIVDEASRVPDELFHAITPMLAVSGGRLLGLSTPWGRRGWWHHEWVEGGDAWQRVEIPALRCPRIAPAFLEQERRSLPSFVFRQEYACAFEQTDDALYVYDDIMAALSDDVAPLFGPATATPTEGTLSDHYFA